MMYPTSSDLLRRTLTTVAAFAAVSSLMAQSDNFDDGNDTGWTRYDPLSALGAPFAQFTFPNGAYRIQALASPDPVNAGQARAGSFRTDVSYSDFYVSVDIKEWHLQLDQAFGLFGRARNIGLGQTDGYVFNYNPKNSAQSGQIQINRVDDEGAETLATFDVTLDPVLNDYQIVFKGVGGLLTGQIFKKATPPVPIALLTATDTTYADGFCGVFVFDLTGPGTADATFENYVAAATEPPNLPTAPTIAGATLVNGELRFGFPAQAGFSYQVQKANTLPAVALDWTAVQTYPAEQNASVKQVAVPATGNAGFVRVISPAPAQ